MFLSTWSSFRSFLQRTILIVGKQQEKYELQFCPFAYKLKLSWKSFSVKNCNQYIESASKPGLCIKVP